MAKALYLSVYLSVISCGLFLSGCGVSDYGADTTQSEKDLNGVHPIDESFTQIVGEATPTPTPTPVLEAGPEETTSAAASGSIGSVSVVEIQNIEVPLITHQIAKAVKSPDVKNEDKLKTPEMKFAPFSGEIMNSFMSDFDLVPDSIKNIALAPLKLFGLFGSDEPSRQEKLAKSMSKAWIRYLKNEAKLASMIDADAAGDTATIQAEVTRWRETYCTRRNKYLEELNGMVKIRKLQEKLEQLSPDENESDESVEKKIEKVEAQIGKLNSKLIKKSLARMVKWEKKIEKKYAKIKENETAGKDAALLKLELLDLKDKYNYLRVQLMDAVATSEGVQLSDGQKAELDEIATIEFDEGEADTFCGGL